MELTIDDVPMGWTLFAEAVETQHVTSCTSPHLG